MLPCLPYASPGAVITKRPLSLPFMVLELNPGLHTQETGTELHSQLRLSSLYVPVCNSWVCLEGWNGLTGLSSWAFILSWSRVSTASANSLTSSLPVLLPASVTGQNADTFLSPQGALVSCWECHFPECVCSNCKLARRF